MSTRVVTFCFTGAGQQTWTVDRNCSLVGMGNTGQTLVATDPALTLAGLAATSGFLNTVLFYNGSNTTNLRPKVSIPLAKGEKIFLTVAGGNQITLFLE